MGGGGLIAPCLLFQVLANDVHACVCIYIYIFMYIDVYIQIDIHMYIGLCMCRKKDEAVGMKVSASRSDMMCMRVCIYMCLGSS